MFRARKVDIADALVQAQVQTLAAEVFKPEDFVGDRIPRYIDGYWWIVYASGEPAAFAGLRPSSRWADTGYLCMAGVLPEFRGHGLQKRLIRLRLAQSRANGWHTAITETLHDNPASQRSLIECGFRPYLPTVKWGDTDHLVYWRRSLYPRAARAPKDP